MLGKHFAMDSAGESGASRSESNSSGSESDQMSAKDSDSVAAPESAEVEDEQGPESDDPDMAPLVENDDNPRTLTPDLEMRMARSAEDKVSSCFF